MQRSESIGQLAKALAKAQGMMDDASKDSTNPHFRSKYADLAAVRAAIRLPFSQNGLAYVQLPRFNGECVEVETILMHAESGEFIGDTMTIPVTKRDAHGIGSATTYGRRFSLMAIAGIAPDEDDDGNAATERPRQQYHRPAPAQGPTREEKAASQEPIDEIPHLSPAQEAAASAKAVTDAARQSAAATATVAKMATDAAMPVDPKAAAIARKEARAMQDADRFSRNSQEVLERLEGNIAGINPRDKDARAKARAWDQTRKFAQSNLTDEHKLAAMQMGASLLAEIKKAEEAIKKPGAYRPGEDDPLPEHDPATRELAE